jgi:hypothetical protein
VVSLRRFADRWLALSLAVSPLWTTVGATSVGYSAAWAGALASITLLAGALLWLGPSHDSDDVWRFGAATLLGDVAVSLAVEHGLGFRLVDHPVVGVGVWVVAVAGALGFVVWRRPGATPSGS